MGVKENGTTEIEGGGSKNVQVFTRTRLVPVIIFGARPHGLAQHSANPQTGRAAVGRRRPVARTACGGRADATGSFACRVLSLVVDAVLLLAPPTASFTEQTPGR